MTEPGARTVRGREEVRPLVGTHLGFSSWHQVDQNQVNQFAEATGDHQWIHVDPARAAQSPFGGTVAHGFLTLSLMPMLMAEIIAYEGFSMGVNYGCDRVRFPAAVLVGSEVRAGATLDSAQEHEWGVQLATTITVEIKDQAKPACVFTSLARLYV